MPGDPVAPGRAAAFFPLVGAALGLAGAGVFLLAGLALPVSLAALATVAFWTAVSGVLHEDGLADVADAVRAGRPQAQILTILKDSRIGTFGAVALILSVLARWQALESLATDRVVEALVASQAVPRAAMVAMAWTSRPTGDGLGHRAFIYTRNARCVVRDGAGVPLRRYGVDGGQGSQSCSVAS